MKKLLGYAHCDGPCGVYDPASARIAGEAVLSMTKKMLDLECPDTSNSKAMASYLNTMNKLIKDWMIKNQFNLGPNWKCGQEASIRVINLIVSYEIIGGNKIEQNFEGLKPNGWIILYDP